MDRNEGRAADYEDEELPFALVEPQEPASAAAIDNGARRQTDNREGNHTDVVSSPSDASQGNSDETSQHSMLVASALHNNSQFLDAAASLLSSNSLLTASSLPQNSRFMQTVSSSTAQSASVHEPAIATGDSVQFSQLLRQASGSYNNHDSQSQQKLAVLQEEQYTFSPREFLDQSTAFIGSPQSAGCGRQQGTFQHCSTSASRLQSNGLAETIIPAGPDSSLYRSEDRRLASLAGATGTRTGDNSFAVSVELSPSCCSVQDVVDVLGNPDMLPLWCDAVRDLVITRASEGASREVNCVAAIQQGDRGEYEGRWIEATSSPLALPKHTSCFYRTGRCMASIFGFPSYGRIHLFVERQRGQIGVTMAPFPGAREMSHKFTVMMNPRNDKVRIVDTVVMQRDINGGTACCCGIWDSLEACFLPSIDDYLDQCLSSMARLRFLLENGERGSDCFDSNDVNAAFETEWRAVASAPLLAGAS